MSKVKSQRSKVRRGGWLRLHAWVVFAFLYAPILVLVVYSFSTSIQTGRWAGPTGHWYAHALRDRELIESATNSLGVALTATAVSTVVGTLAGLALAKSARGRSATKGLLFLPIVFPEVVIGAALFTFFVALSWQLGFWSIVAGHLAFSVSYVAIIVRARLAGFDPSLEEAARDLGAGPAGVFWRVKLPLIWPGILAGALLAFTLSIDDYVITSKVAGSFKTLPLAVYDKLKVNATPETNAISTMLLGLTIALIATAAYLMRSKGKDKAEG
jgi:spermidine/putrescine transport system permease protein